MKIIFILSLINCFNLFSISVNVLDIGAIPDGKTINTKIFQRAIDSCFSNGGGKVIIPSGSFLVGALFLKSNIHIQFELGSTIIVSKDTVDFPVIQGKWEGIERKTYSSLFTSFNSNNIVISGNGKIEGQGEFWWRAYDADKNARKKIGIYNRELDNPLNLILKWPRPRIINFFNCKDIIIKDIEIYNSPSWNIHPVYCKRITINNVKFFSPEYPFARNTDGIDPESCSDVFISNCFFDLGDDCIAIKSGYNEDGLLINIPCENIIISDCIFKHGQSGVAIGSEMSGGVKNVLVTNCIFDGTKRGLRVKTARGRGGVVADFRVSNLIMRNITDAALSITMQYGNYNSLIEDSVTIKTPCLKDFYWNNISIENCDKVACFDGLAEMPVKNINISDINVISANRGVYLKLVEDVVFKNITLNINEDFGFDILYSKNINILNCILSSIKNNVQFANVMNSQNIMIINNTDRSINSKFGIKKDKNSRIKVLRK